MAERQAETQVGRKRKKNYYVKNVKRRSSGRELCSGMRGILITCSGNERRCVQDAYNILNEIAETIYGPEDTTGILSSSDEDDCNEACDIEKKIDKEVNVLKDRKERRFNSVHSGAKSMIFIKCADDLDPCVLVHRLLCDARDSGVQKTRFCSRFIPVSKVFTASLSEIKKHSLSIISEHFHGLDPKPVEFAVHCKCRNNSVIQRKDVVDLVASLVSGDGTYPHIVNLDNPELVVMVMIIKNVCCVSVVKDFFILKQYNIQSLYQSHAEDPSAVIESSGIKSTSQSSLENNQGTLVEKEKPPVNVTVDKSV